MIFGTDSICEFNKPIYILLKDSENDRITEFFSSEFYGTTLGPRVTTQIDITLTEETQIDKFIIE